MSKYVILDNNKNSGNLLWKTDYESDKLTIGTCTVMSNSNFSPHWHETTEIYRIIDGNGRIYIKKPGQKSIWKDVKPNDLIIIEPYTIHCCDTNSKITIEYIFDKGPFNTVKYFGLKSNL